ncbi:DnaJ-domain-containing protein [Myriangium duriaei CBS 260.36]|uniref:DnaJ-domain-containing protein n=1 Tax=Myriangium duriaei CBS 260.36 TaxID=1168546 RepID=A0A9P4MJ36_9PEZI|nr:DnaJ-domain-containing protein [Myriangium duriaei CBS 260.36]
MPSDDLKSHALSSHDFYALLDVTPVSSEAEIRRAYRKTALKYHPDKHGGSTEAVDKFHLLQIAYDVLSDGTAKGIYDSARRARQEREERERAFGDRRRRMKEDLERRESGVKRVREEDIEEERLAQEIEQDHGGLRNGAGVQSNGTAPDEISEMDRSVKVKWRREGAGETTDKAGLEEIFKRYGEVDCVVMLKDKKKKLDNDGGGKKGKMMIGTAVIIYKSVASAHAAVEEVKKLAIAFDSLESVFWATNEEPTFISNLRTPASPAATPTKPTLVQDTTASPNLAEVTRIRMRLAQQARDAKKNEPDGPTVRKVPSFASFRGVSTPQKPPKTSFSASSTPLAFDSPAFNSPGLEQIQKRRQREEEKRQLEEQIRAQEAAEI